MDADEFTEPRRVVVPRSFSISIGFQNGVSSHNLILQCDLLVSLLCRGGDDCQVGDHLLGVLRLARPGLAGDQHSLVLAIPHHSSVGSLGNGPEVRRDFIAPFSKVDLGDPMAVDRIPFVGVDNNNEEA